MRLSAQALITMCSLVQFFQTAFSGKPSASLPRCPWSYSPFPIFSPQLCAKQQQKLAFLPWQLDIVLFFFINSAALETSPPSPQQQQQQQMQPGRELPQGRRECVRALAQLVYDNGERLGSRFEVILPPLLELAAPSTVDLDTRYVGRACFTTRFASRASRLSW